MQSFNKNRYFEWKSINQNVEGKKAKYLINSTKILPIYSKMNTFLLLLRCATWRRQWVEKIIVTWVDLKNSNQPTQERERAHFYFQRLEASSSFSKSAIPTKYRPNIVWREIKRIERKLGRDSKVRREKLTIWRYFRYLSMIYRSRDNRYWME